MEKTLINKFLTIILIISFFNLFGQSSKLKIIQIGCLDLNKVIQFVSKNLVVKSKLLGVEKEILDQANELEKQIELLEKELENFSLNKAKQSEIKSQIDFEKKKINDLLRGNVDSKKLDILFHSKLAPSLIKGVYRVIQNVSSKNGYSMILEKNQGIIYVNDEVDITDLVIEDLKKQ